MSLSPRPTRRLIYRGELLPALLTLVATAFVLACMGFALLPAAAYVRWLLGADLSGWRIACLPFAWLIWGTTLSAICVAVRWLLLPRIPEGTFDAYSCLVIRWGVVHRLTHLAQSTFIGQFTNTPWVNLWFRALGARVGSGVTLNSTDITDWDLLSIGDGTMVGFRAGIQAHAGDRGTVRFTRVEIGANTQVGRDAMIFDGVTMGDGAILAPASLAPPGKQLLGDSVWCGVPVRRATPTPIEPRKVA